MQSPARRPAVVSFLLFVLVSGVSVLGMPAQETATMAQRIDKVFERWSARTPGCAVGVARQGRTIYTQGYGLASLEYGVRIRPDTVFESGSVAKQFTAGAVALLVQDGKLSLDDPIRTYLPEVPDFGTPILIRHLLTHTSGLRSQWPLLTMMGRPPGRAVHTVPEIVELVGFQTSLNFTPGDEYLYNNTAFTLLTVIVERVSGKPFAEFSQERLFKPLGMTRTQWRDDFTAIVPGRATAYRMGAGGTFRTYMPITNVIGNGGLLTTVGDMLLWNENLDNPRVGGRAWAEMLQTPARLNDGSPLDYALGLSVQRYRGVREISHGGSTAGYQTFLARFPDERLSVAVLCNTTGANPGGDAHQVAELFLGGALKPATVVTAIQVPADVLSRVAGLYRERTTDAVTRVVWDKDRKVLLAGGQPLAPTAPGVLSSADGARTLSLDVGGAQPAWPATAAVVAITDKTGHARPRVWHAEAPFAPTPEQLEPFTGMYVSEELGVTYAVLRDGDHLVLRFRPAQRIALEPVFADGFEGDGQTVRFTRDAGGRIDGFNVFAGRARHVRFTRQ
ncbi:MAG: serine hydrolase domain-containing protein [Vicinamibacterales bacterium]|nr:serine hydrolase domain-containing protein [Vicinamibacterales bacterium]